MKSREGGEGGGSTQRKLYVPRLVTDVQVFENEFLLCYWVMVLPLTSVLPPLEVVHGRSKVFMLPTFIGQCALSLAKY